MGNVFHRFHKAFPFLVYLIAGILCFPFFMYQINPDGVCYISIAKSYASYNFHDAINGYWSPMISWIMAPFVSFGFNPLVIFKVINIIIGYGCLFQTGKVIRVLLPEIRLRYLNELMLASFSIPIVYFALSVVTPDLLATFFLLVYTNLVIEKKVFENKILVAFIGALMFFAKAYFFWFFILHLTIYFIYSPISSYTNNKVKSFCLILLFFFLIITPWEISLYSKYNKVVISLAAKYDHAMMVSGKLENTYEEELSGMPNQNAVSAWEDISLVDSYQDWSPFGSIKSLFMQLKFISNYFVDFLIYVLTWPVLIISLGGSLIHLLQYRKDKSILCDPIFDNAILSFIYVSGYALFFFEPRYFWGLFIVNIVVAYYFLYKTSMFFSKNNLRIYSLFSCVFILINIPPIKEITGFVINVPGRIEVIHSRELKDIIPIGSNVASYWFGEARYISYYLGLHDFGGICAYTDNEKLKSDLKKFNIDFVIEPCGIHQPPPLNYKYIGSASFNIYDIRMISN